MTVRWCEEEGEEATLLKTCKRKLNPFLSTVHGDLYFCHHVIIVSKHLQGAFSLDVERCCLDGTCREFGMTQWASRAGELALVCL